MDVLTQLVGPNPVLFGNVLASLMENTQGRHVCCQLLYTFEWAGLFFVSLNQSQSFGAALSLFESQSGCFPPNQILFSIFDSSLNKPHYRGPLF